MCICDTILCDRTFTMKMLVLTLSILFIHMAFVHCNCLDGWIRFDDSCYLFENTNKLNWTNAQKSCVDLSSNLVAVDSEREHNFIKAELVKLNLEREDQFWTAGNDLQSEGNFVLVNANERMVETFWATGEPNQDGGNEDCVAYYKKLNLGWNDEHCESPYFYICEQGDTNTDN